jgi:hypothetical protein
MTVPNQDSILEEIKRRLNLGNACYHAAHNLSFSHLLSKNINIKVYKTVILHVFCMGVKEHRLRVFENRVLRRIFGLKKEKVIGGWRNLHNEELHNLYSLPNVIRTINSRRMSLAGHVACLGKRMNAYRSLVGKQEGKQPLGRP